MNNRWYALFYISYVYCCRISLNTMTLQVQSDHVYTQLGVPVSVTGVAQVLYSTYIESLPHSGFRYSNILH